MLNDIVLNDEAATLACGARFAAALPLGAVVYLHGDLGAGKTTFTRGILQGLGHIGKVKSPTYTLLEIYNLNSDANSSYHLYHYDLYRFTSEEEWDATGFRDYFNGNSLSIIEWPEKAPHVLPAADIHVHLSLYDFGRKISFSANTALGNACLKNL